MEIKLGDLISFNNKTGVVFDVTDSVEDDYETLGCSVRYTDGTITTFNIDDFYDDEGPQIVTPKTYVNVYLHDKAYGGPEEGGWWFHTLEPVEEYSKNFDTEKEAEAYLKSIEEELIEENSNRKSDISSVISEGCFEACLEAWPAEHYPKRRPVYC